MSDRLAAWIRTVWPMLLGYLAAWLLAQSWAPTLVSWLAAAGVDVTEAGVVHLLGWLLGAAVYSAGRWLERRAGGRRLHRLARAVGRFILSIGLPTGQPAYSPPPRGLPGYPGR